jgi:hypothetical protein
MSATLKGGINLAYWLYKVHPQLFSALLGPAQQAAQQARSTTLGRFADDFVPDTGDFVAFDTSSFDYSATSVPELSSVDVSAALDPVIVDLPDPQLSSVGIDAALTTPSISFDTSGAAAPASAAGGLTGALSSIGSFLNSATGLSSLTNLATAVYKANTPQAATIGTQIARVQAGANPAPITYGYNSAGQLVPILAQANTAGIALNSQTLAGLIPASLTPYVVPAIIGIVLLWALTGSKK